MATHSSLPAAPTGGNPFLRVVAAISTVAGWTSAAMIVAAVAMGAVVGLITGRTLERLRRQPWGTAAHQRRSRPVPGCRASLLPSG